MAAFLTKMKSVKLRRTGSLASTHSTGPPPEHRLSTGGTEAVNKHQRRDDSSSTRTFISCSLYPTDLIHLVFHKLKQRLTTSFCPPSVPREDSLPPTHSQLHGGQRCGVES